MRAEWVSRDARLVIAAATQLESAATVVIRNATEQRQTSAVDGAGGAEGVRRLAAAPRPGEGNGTSGLNIVAAQLGDDDGPLNIDPFGGPDDDPIDDADGNGLYEIDAPGGDPDESPFEPVPFHPPGIYPIPVPRAPTPPAAPSRPADLPPAEPLPVEPPPDEPPPAEAVPELSPDEQDIAEQARAIYRSPGMETLRDAARQGVPVAVVINGRTVLYEPTMPEHGFSLFTENGFVLGPKAFASEEALGKTIAHEMYRLETSEAAGGIHRELAERETFAANAYADRAVHVVIGP
jgi:hypothetical protein